MSGGGREAGETRNGRREELREERGRGRELGKRREGRRERGEGMNIFLVLNKGEGEGLRWEGK